MKKKINFKELKKTREEKLIELALYLKKLREIKKDNEVQLEYTYKNYETIWKLVECMNEEEWKSFLNSTIDIISYQKTMIQLLDAMITNANLKLDNV